jgi:hypothetical protein
MKHWFRVTDSPARSQLFHWTGLMIHFSKHNGTPDAGMESENREFSRCPEISSIIFVGISTRQALFWVAGATADFGRGVVRGQQPALDRSASRSVGSE